MPRHRPRRLTLPSRGRATSGFAGCRPPLMSNVRPRKKRPPSSIEREFTAMHLLPSSTQHRSPSKALVPAVSHKTVHARTIEIPFQSASALEAPPRVNVGQFVGAGAVAPARSARSRSQWCRLHRPSRVVVASAIHGFRQPARPNPSIERTFQRPLRALWPAAHVKRWAS